MFNAPVASFIGIGAQLQDTHGYVDRHRRHPAPATRPDARCPRETGAAAEILRPLEVDNVSFGYSPVTPPQLIEVSLRSSPGARIGIVGGSGSGKSTLGRLMVALAAPQ